MRNVEKAKLKATLADETARAQERMAQEKFTPELVRAACMKAAQSGKTGCMIAPAEPVNVVATATATALIAWLKAEGLGHQWIIARDQPDGSDYPRLEVTWDAAAAPAAAPLSGVRNANE